MHTVLSPAWVAQHNQAAAPSGPALLTGVSASTSTQAGYFTDQHGQPMLWLASETWVLFGRAGEWNGGNPGLDFTDFFTARAAQGFTVCMLDVMDSSYDSSANPPYLNGNTWDDIAPFATGTDPSSGLNSTFWTRVDSMFAAALAAGITIGFTFNSNYDGSVSGSPMYGWTTTQAQAYGTAVGARYKNQPNLVWLFGNDCYQGNFDTTWDYIRTGLTGAGDSHLVIAWWEAEYTSRYETDNNTAITWGGTNSAADFTYTYNAGYWVIEYAYDEVTARGAPALLPVLQGDGYFYQGGTTYSATLDRAYRQEQWWCLASGARGILYESEAVYSWASAAALTAVTGEWFASHNQANIVTAFTSWAGWHLLLPDLTSAFVTAGRGTRVSGYSSGGGGGQYEPAFTNSYVAASVTPDGSLAVCYLPNSATITCTTSMLASGWAAYWIDPVSGAASSAGGGPTFNSASKGNNSQGDPDWVLVFHS